jgi:hypothetical protein
MKATMTSANKPPEAPVNYIKLMIDMIGLDHLVKGRNDP